MSDRTNFDDFSGNYRQVLDASLAFAGASAEWFARYKALYTLRIVGDQFRERVLDFGCGVGLVASFLKELLPRAMIDGYDVSQASIELIDASLRSQGLFSSSLEDLGEDYGCILVANVFHHVPPEQRQEFMSNLRTRLRPGGKLVIFEHNPMNPVTRRVVRHCPFDEDAILLSPRELYRYMERANLLQKRRDYIVFFPEWLSCLHPLEKLLSWCFLGAQYAVVGERDV